MKLAVRILITVMTVLCALGATAGIVTAHEELDTPPTPLDLPHRGPAHLEVSTSSVELTETEDGFSGTFEIRNTGTGTLSITRVWIPTVAEETLLPSGSGVVLEQAGKSALIAPGQTKTAVVTWTGNTRARELYGHVLIASNAIDPEDKTLRGPIAVGIHAEKAIGPLGWLGSHILSLLLLVPLAGAFAVGVAFAAGVRDGRRVRRIALAAASLEVFLAGWLYAFLDRGMTIDDGHRGYQFIEKAVLAPSAGVHYFVGVDGISTPFVALGALLSWIAVWILREDADRICERAVFGLVTTSAAIGVFVALDLMWMLLCYLVLVVTLAFWIAAARTRAALRAGSRFGLIGALGGFFLLLAFLWLGLYGDASYLADGTRSAHTFSLTDLELVDWVGKRLRMGTVLALKPVMVALILGFGALLPLFPLHTWVPDVAEEGSTGAALFALGLVTKVGIYGLLRIGVGVVPHAMAWAAPGLAALGVAALVHAALVALASKDLKRLVGYASISQMGLALLGVAAMTPQGFEGALTVGIAHGLGAPLLLVLVGALGDQAKTTLIDRFGGLARALPRHSALLALGMGAAVGAPGLIGFWGEVLTIVGAFARYRMLTSIACAGLVVLAGVHVWALARVSYGKLRASWTTAPALARTNGRFVDLSSRSTAAAVALVVLSALLGVWPRPLLDTMDKRVLELHRRIDEPGQTQIAVRPTRSSGQPHA